MYRTSAWKRSRIYYHSGEMRSSYEVADVFRLGMESYQRHHRISARQLKVLQDIQDCRTSALGGHMDACDACGHVRISYNSCRNSHCPKCQSMAREVWLEKRRSELLPVRYFHLVFTLPSELHDLLRYNERLAYNQLFRLAWESLCSLTADKKYLGATTGMVAVLHTWGQNLHYHPHIHCLIPAGGLTKAGKWKEARKNYLVPVKALSILFRAKYISFLRRAHRQGQLKMSDLCAQWASSRQMNQLLNRVYRKDWVVYAKAPFGGPEHVLNYLGRYVKRVAISNDRILKVDEEQRRVSFRWRDYADGDKSKVMSLSCEEFIRRFIQHILPKRFSKVRYYGLMANRDKTKRLSLCFKAMGHVFQPKKVEINWQERLYQLTGIDPNFCPCCQQGRMHIFMVLLPSRAPPTSCPPTNTK